MNNLDRVIRKFIKAKEKYNEAETELNFVFGGYTTFLEEGDFEGAKEYLREMPECASKVLCFRHILLAEGMGKI